MKLTREQLKRIAEQEVAKLMNENISRRELCKNAALAGTAAWLGAGCELEYDMGHVSDQNLENMQLPECVQNCYFNDYDNPDAWPKPLEQFSQQFEGEKYIETIVSSDLSKMGFNTFSGLSGLVVLFHNVPAESPSLEEVMQMSDEEIEARYTHFDGNEAILSTVEVCFLMKDNMLYLNPYQPGSPYYPEGQSEERFRNARPESLISQDHYRRRGDLKQCRDAYEAYLYGPIRKDKQEAP